jgi:hypothetical protein
MARLTARRVPDKLAESERRHILAQAPEGGQSDFWVRADAFRNRTKPQKSNSGRLQREMRNAR